jgi:hypothetical protein
VIGHTQMIPGASRKILPPCHEMCEPLSLQPVFSLLVFYLRRTLQDQVGQLKVVMIHSLSGIVFAGVEEEPRRVLQMPAQESVIYPESVTELPLSSLRSRSFLPSHLDTRLLIPSLDVRWNSSGWSRSMTNLWKTLKNLPRGLRASFAALNSLILRGKLVAKNWIRRRIQSRAQIIPAVPLMRRCTVRALAPRLAAGHHR